MYNSLKAGIAGVAIIAGSASLAQANTIEQTCADFNNYEKSITACDKIINSQKYNKKRKANALVNKCAALGKREKYDELIFTCEKAIKINPNIRIANYNIGWAYAKKNDRIKAVLFYKRELETNPNYKSALNELCYQSLNLNHYIEALGYCKKSILLDSEQKIPFYNLAVTYKELGYFKAAVDSFDSFIKLTRAKNKDDLDSYEASNEVAALEKKLEDFKTDIEGEWSTGIITHADWKSCLADQPGARTQEKLEACERIILRPKWVKPEDGGWSNTGRLTELLTARAEARADLKQHDLALLDYDFLLNVNPKSPEVLIGRAASHEGLGNLRSAAKDVKAALLLLPSTDPLQSRLREQLENLEYKIRISTKSVQKKKREALKKNASTSRANTRKKKKKNSARRKSQTPRRLKTYEDAYAYCRKRYGRGNVQTVRKKNGKYICHLHAYSPNE